MLAIFAALAFLASGCEPKEKTKEELLTQTKGWVLSAATSEPPYIMLADEGEEPEHLRNLINGYFFPYELDDIYFYETSGALKVDPGTLLPKEDEDEIGYDKVQTLGTWVLNYPKLTTKVPSFYDKNSDGTWAMDVATITELNETTLTYTYTFNAAKKKGSKAKADEIYTFTLTFTKK